MITAVIAFVVLFLLIFAGMPIAFALGTVGFVGLIISIGFPGAMTQLALVPYATVAQYVMSVIPLYVLMGNLAFISGLTKDAYNVGYKWLGPFPGGLALATIGGCAGFAACTGSSVASISIMGEVALPEMRRYKYDDKLATGSIAAGTTLGILIPPSAPMIIYALLAEASIGKLFIAGVVPGLLLTALFMVTVLVISRVSPSAGPRGPKTTLREKLVSLGPAVWVLLLAGTVLGGIWGGIFTPIEAGGVGAFLAFVIALVRKRLSKGNLLDSLRGAIRVSAMIFAMLIGATLFSYFFVVTGVIQTLGDYVAALPVPPIVIVIAMMAAYLIGGCLMDVAGLMMVTLPIFIPIVKVLGVDLVYFGILITIMMEMALITPPIGLNVFILRGIDRTIPMSTMFRGVLPFVGAMIVGLALILAFPQIVLFLSGTMK